MDDVPIDVVLPIDVLFIIDVLRVLARVSEAKPGAAVPWGKAAPDFALRAHPGYRSHR
jgi:hypothetical protein